MINRITYFTIIFFLTFGLQNSSAGLVSTINDDTLNQLDVTWYWDETVPSEDEPILSNWSDDISLQFYSASDPNDFIGGVNITEYFPNDRTIYASQQVILISPFKSDQYGILTDVYTSTSNANYHFLFDRNPNCSESIIKLTATAVPIPGVLWLLGSGIFSLVALKRIKK